MDAPTTLDPSRKKVINLVAPVKGEPNERVIKALRETLEGGAGGQGASNWYRGGADRP